MQELCGQRSVLCNGLTTSLSLSLSLSNDAWICMRSSRCSLLLDVYVPTRGQVLHIHRTEPEGDILAFLTGQHEIETACRTLAELDRDLDYEREVQCREVHGMVVYPIYSSLETLEQQAIFDPPPRNYRKVVFATNIAATSVTIDGVVHVVDSGFVKQKMFDASIGG